MISKKELEGELEFYTTLKKQAIDQLEFYMERLLKTIKERKDEEFFNSELLPFMNEIKIVYNELQKTEEVLNFIEGCLK